MSVQTVFQRYELKYLITDRQKDRILQKAQSYLSPDRYGRTTVRNLYFDTDTYLLIRRSIEKPPYKEKLRIRSYSKAEGDTRVFAELKKKYQSLVYKRRVSLPYDTAVSWLSGEGRIQNSTQISEEIEYFRDFYGTLRPTVFLSYQREAFYWAEREDFRVTFDSNILVRETDLSLKSEVYGTPVLDDGTVLMEIKCFGGIPLWMTEILSEEKIYKTAFSKYGTTYREIIYPRLLRESRKEQD